MKTDNIIGENYIVFSMKIIKKILINFSLVYYDSERKRIVNNYYERSNLNDYVIEKSKEEIEELIPFIKEEKLLPFNTFNHSKYDEENNYEFNIIKDTDEKIRENIMNIFIDIHKKTNLNIQLVLDSNYESEYLYEFLFHRLVDGTFVFPNIIESEILEMRSFLKAIFIIFQEKSFIEDYYTSIEEFSETEKISLIVFNFLQLILNIFSEKLEISF